MRIIWSPLALDRVEEIAREIAREDPVASQKWIHEVFRLAATLSSFPRRGRIVPEVGRPEIREILYRGYRIIHKVEEKRISILTVRHGRRLLDPEEIA